MMTDAEPAAHSDLPIPPGELLAEDLATIGMPPRQFEQQTGLPVQTLVEVIAGEAPITDDRTLRLEKALSSPAHLWLNLEAQDQAAKVREALTGR
jgi:addiction module HigA family antidote